MPEDMTTKQQPTIRFPGGPDAATANAQANGYRSPIDPSLDLLQDPA